MNLPDTHKAKVRQARQILRLAISTEIVAAEKGCDTTVADILIHAGMSRRSFYEFFASREDAYRRIFAASKAHPWAPSCLFMLYMARPGFNWDIDVQTAFQVARDAATRERIDPSEEELLAWREAIIKGRQEP